MHDRCEIRRSENVGNLQNERRWPGNRRGKRRGGVKRLESTFFNGKNRRRAKHGHACSMVVRQQERTELHATGRQSKFVLVLPRFRRPNRPGKTFPQDLSSRLFRSELLVGRQEDRRLDESHLRRTTGANNTRGGRKIKTGEERDHGSHGSQYRTR